MAIFELLDYIVNEVRGFALHATYFLCAYFCLLYYFYVAVSLQCHQFSAPHLSLHLQPPPKLPHGVYTMDFEEFVTKW